MNNKLSLTDLSDQLAENAKISKKEASTFLKNLFDLIEENLVEDKLVKIKGLGTFKLIWVENRRIANVNTGEIQEIPGHYKTSFTPDLEISSSVNEPYSHLETVVLDEETITDNPILHKETFTPEITAESVENTDTSWVQQEQLEEHTDFQAMMNEERQTVTDLVAEPTHYPEVENVPETLSEEPISAEAPVQPKKKRKKKKNNGSWKYAIFVFSAIAAFFAIIFVINLRAPEEKIVKIEEPPIGDLVYDIPKDTVADTNSAKSVEKKATISDIKDKATPQKISENKLDKKVSSGVKIIAKETIEPGSRLTLMAQKYYGNKIFWVYIYMANSDKIKNPNNVPTGIVLDIPDNEVYDIDQNDSASLARARKLSVDIQANVKSEK